MAHRSRLIAQLESYARRYSAEAETVARFLDFVRGHERCFERDCLPGHVTGSAWLLDPSRQRVLLTRHRKLNRWLQPGGHCDGDPDTLAVAIREAEEESGLAVNRLTSTPLDIDIHRIPARGPEPAHLHFDVRYALAAQTEAFTVSDESDALAWVHIQALETCTNEISILRMREKWVMAAAR